LPKPLLNPGWREVLDTLCGATVLQENAEERDAETRVNAVKSLATVCETLGVEKTGYESRAEGQPRGEKAAGESSARTDNRRTSNGGGEALTPGKNDTQSEDSKLPASVVSGQVMEHLLAALDDYATDNRGDVGSWVREAAMESIEKVTYLLCHVAEDEHSHVAVEAKLDDVGPSGRGSNGEIADGSENTASSSGINGVSAHCEIVFTPDLAARVVGGLAKQAAEKIDRVRNVAGSILQRLLSQGDPPIAAIPHGAFLRQIIPGDAVINWAVSSGFECFCSFQAPFFQAPFQVDRAA
jgi:hypothetical protein